MMTRMSGILAVALAAGTVLPTHALAQKSAGKAPPAPQVPMVSVERPARAPDPDMVRSVMIMPDGTIQPLSDWRPYTPPAGSGDRAIEFVFDAMHDQPGSFPGTIPLTGRYTLNWPGGVSDYTGSYRAKDMNDIPAAARGLGAKMCDVIYRENNAATPLFIAISTAEEFFPGTPPDASWNMYPGVQFTWAAGVGVGFWFSAFNVTTQPPPVGDGWKMPTDGNGAYLIKATRDAAGMVPAQGWQTGLWGTGNNVTPPIARVGTQGEIEWSDESTPPECGASGLATNIANGILEGGSPTVCEAGPWVFAVPFPAPGVLASAIGFGMDVVAPPTCYANCDGSTAPPILNVNDFICFQGLYAAQDTRANCDGSTANPILNVNDFICFQGAYAAGCP